MTAVILQARLDSSRLPRKALLDLAGEPLVFQVMRRLRAVRAQAWVLACPEDCRNEFAPLAARAGFSLVVGSKDDVLARYCDAIRATGCDWVVRATGDNPFVLIDAANAIARATRRLDADYGAYASLPYGGGVECVKSAALLRAEREARLPQEREHVCPYLYTHPEHFYLHRPLAPRPWRRPDIRITVDTDEDYARAQELASCLNLTRASSRAILKAAIHGR